MSYSIESITESIGARRMGNAPATIDWLLTDSRSLNFPEETLFFALTTKRMTVRAILQIYMPVEYVILCLAKKALD